MGYVTQSSDTSRTIEERQTAYFRRLGKNGRLSCGAQIIDEGFESLEANLRREHPDWSPQQLRLEWVRRHYGEELAARYEKHLQCSRNKTNGSNFP
ncbi:MAG: hypothetical protein KY445_13335 [Armatimonadetes bacterium]|nr:hypothetical protein [Armatimonadota bacterium]